MGRCAPYSGFRVCGRPLGALLGVCLAGAVAAAPPGGEAPSASILEAATISAARSESRPERPGLPPGGLEFIPLTHLFFEYDRVTLNPRAQRTLDDVARFVTRTPGVRRVLIGGHADYTDTTDYNYGLSDLRAEAVRNYLIARGVAGELLRFHGFGELRPTDENWTRSGRRRNRRVEIYVVRYVSEQQVTSRQ